MPKGKKGKETALNAPKFVPMPRNWPGKISNEDLFNEFAQKVRANIQSDNAYPLVSLRIRQLGFESKHDFVITVSKSLTIYQLQCYIANIQHANAVYPADIVIFNQKTKSASEKLLALTGQFTDILVHQDDLGIGIPRELVCVDPSKSLKDYFPELSAFKCEREVFQH
jgi:hypothetical protein